MPGDAFPGVVRTVGRARRARLLLTCEHASNRLPRPWRATGADQRLLGTHWGYDLGAAWLTEALGALEGASAILSTVSRLVMDVNRAPDDPAAVLQSTDDGAPTFNRHVDLPARVARFHAPFHAAVDAALRRHRPEWLCSVHSFTPTFRGYARSMAAGVLFDQFDHEAALLAAAMTAEGLPTVLNEPYSGKAGLIYSAKRHGDAHGIPYLELEVRQDLLATPERASAVAAQIARAWRRSGLYADSPPFG